MISYVPDSPDLTDIDFTEADGKCEKHAAKQEGITENDDFILYSRI